MREGSGNWTQFKPEINHVSRKTMTEFLHKMSMQVLNREEDNILLDFENIADLVTNIIALLRQQNKKSQQINDVNKAEVDRQINH